MEAASYIEGILSQDRVVLAKSLTLIESSLAKDQEIALEVLEACMAHSGKSDRIAVSGSPGVGKSSFIEQLGLASIADGNKVAVLAIDPSSQVAGGSILGDKTRMEQLSTKKEAFIRPSPAADFLGGVALKTRESIILCEAAGFNKIIIETVGVGQSEIAAANMSDLFLVLVLAGAGDELQGIKRGIIELADMIAINKADGDNVSKAQKAKQSYLNALHLFPVKRSGQKVDVHAISSLNGMGIAELKANIESYLNAVKKNGFFSLRRQDQNLSWLNDCIKYEIQKKYKELSNEHYSELIENVKKGLLIPSKAAVEMIRRFSL